MIAHWFTLLIYQPFLNLLVLIYWAIQHIPNLVHKDMGIAVIIFTIALRIILLPISLASERSEQERRDIEAKAKELNQKLSHDPVELKTQMKSLFKNRPRMLLAESFNLLIQVSIAFMLWRIFARGLGGEDLHLLYSFMPNVKQPYDLVFLGKFDLTHPHAIMNIIQSVVIFAAETISIMTSLHPMGKKEAWRIQITLPIVSYIIFSLLPAGKKLFVITTLLFSIVYTLIRYVYHLWYSFSHPIAAVLPSDSPEIPAVVATTPSPPTHH